MELKTDFTAAQSMTSGVQPVKKKRRIWLWLLMIFVVIPMIIVMLLGLLGQHSGEEDLGKSLGVSPEEVVKVLGNPEKKSTDDVGDTVWSYDKGTSITFYDNSVGSVILNSSESRFSLFGVKVNADVKTAAQHLVDSGFQYIGTEKITAKVGTSMRLASLHSFTDSGHKINLTITQVSGENKVYIVGASKK